MILNKESHSGTLVWLEWPPRAPEPELVAAFSIRALEHRPSPASSQQEIQFGSQFQQLVRVGFLSSLRGDLLPGSGRFLIDVGHGAPSADHAARKAAYFLAR